MRTGRAGKGALRFGPAAEATKWRRQIIQLIGADLPEH